MAIKPWIGPHNKGPIQKRTVHHPPMHIPPRDLMPLEREDPHPDRKGYHSRIRVRRVDPGMRRIPEPIIKELLPAMGTLETIPGTPPQDRCPHGRRVARWRGV